MTEAFIWMMRISRLNFSSSVVKGECEVGTTVAEINLKNKTKLNFFVISKLLFFNF
jgi:hypothetical protein